VATGSQSSSTIRSGFSACAARTRPHTADAAGSVTTPSPAGTAPRVATTSRDPSSSAAASHCRTTAKTRDVTANASPSPIAVSTATAGGPVSAATSSAVATATHGGDGCPASAGRSTQSTWNSELAAAGACSVGTARNTSESKVRTRPPVWSAASTVIASGPAGVTRTRNADAPTACSTSPFHANGITARPGCSSVPAAAGGWPSGAGAPVASLAVVAAATVPVCRAASSNAGWMPYAAASPRCSSGRATSANTSSPRCHTDRTPWNMGP